MGFDDLCELKVPCDDGHLRREGERGDSGVPNLSPLATVHPAWAPVWGLPWLGAPGSDPGPCLTHHPKGLRGFLGHETLS